MVDTISSDTMNSRHAYNMACFTIILIYNFIANYGMGYTAPETQNPALETTW